jgi:hypothetical protein
MECISGEDDLTMDIMGMDISIVRIWAMYPTACDEKKEFDEMRWLLIKTIIDRKIRRV